jgi:hypothetical protein
MNYTITQSFRGKNKANYNVEDFGDFLSIIDFNVIKNKPPVAQINGIIFQKITKITRIIHKNKNVECLIKTSKEISDYTGKNVNFMSETYLEYFEVTKNNVDGDQFQNSAITKYKNKDVDFKNVSEYGIILQKGECVFIPSTHIGPLINPIYVWIQNVDHASNGLYYFDDKIMPIGQMDVLWAQILAAKQSTIVCHTVEYYWRKDQADKECSSNVYVERLNKTEAEINPYFITLKNIPDVKNKVDIVLFNQAPKCKMRRCNSMNSRVKYVKPGVITSSNVKKVNAAGKNITKTKKVKKSIRKFPGGGAIKSKKRRTVKNCRRNRRKSVKRSRKMH